MARLSTFTQRVTVTVDAPPVQAPATGVDLADCNLGIELRWPPATFPNPAGAVYNVYRSLTSCADALLRAPIASGLTGLTYVDAATTPWGSHWYVIEAEDGLAGTTCTPVGWHHGDSAVRQCLGPIVDAGDAVFPDGVFATLRARHVGDDVTFLWPDARALLPAEHFHLLKAVGHPANIFTRANLELDLQRSHPERDASAPLQFFDLRVANDCEAQSLDEFPPGYDF